MTSLIEAFDGTIEIGLPFRKLRGYKRTDQVLSATFERVERAKQEWEFTVDSLPELICLLDHDDRIIRANRTVESWNLGPVVSVRGVPFHELLHPQCKDAGCYLIDFLNRARVQIGGGQPAELETYDAILGRHMLLRMRPAAEKKRASIPSTVIIVHDVSDRKRMERALQRYTQRLETMNGIGQAILAAHSPEEIAQAALSRIRRLVPFHQATVTLVDAETNHFLFMTNRMVDNPALGHMEVEGAPNLALLQPARSLPPEAFRGSPERQPDRYYMVADLASHADLSQIEQQMVVTGIRAYFSVPLITEHEFIGAVGLASLEVDAFGPEHAEVVREVADMLAIATRQTQLYRKLEQTNDDLERALMAKREMIQNVSHELRTPLTLISGYAKLIREEALGPLTPEQDKALAIMDTESDQLHFMVNRLLTLQTLDAKALQPSSVNPNFLIQQAVDAWQSRAAETRLKLQMEKVRDLPNIYVDYELLNQVLYNLIDNAIKFSPQGGLITVRAWAEEGDTLIAVSDQGVGIDPQKLERIFERFYQVDGSSTRSFGGMGIGLALCMKIVEAHSGRLWASSAGEGAGSTFYIALPTLLERRQDSPEPG